MYIDYEQFIIYTVHIFSVDNISLLKAKPEIFQPYLL